MTKPEAFGLGFRLESHAITTRLGGKGVTPWRSVLAAVPIRSFAVVTILDLCLDFYKMPIGGVFLKVKIVVVGNVNIPIETPFSFAAMNA